MTRSLALLSILLPSLLTAAEMLPLKFDDYALILSEEASEPAVGFPHDEISEKQYLPAKERKTLLLRFSGDRKNVEILPRGISGELTSGDARTRIYKLTKGLFAGGRLAIKAEEEGLVATFTEFGSGRPVISSARGEITPARSKATSSEAQPRTASEPGNEKESADRAGKSDETGFYGALSPQVGGARFIYLGNSAEVKYVSIDPILQARDLETVRVSTRDGSHVVQVSLKPATREQFSTEAGKVEALGRRHRADDKAGPLPTIYEFVFLMDGEIQWTRSLKDVVADDPVTVMTFDDRKAAEKLADRLRNIGTR